MPCLKPNDWNSSVEPGLVESREILDPARSALGLRSLVSMWCAMSAMSASKLALARDAFGQGELAVAQRMAAPRFREALDQRLGLCFQEQRSRTSMLRALADRRCAAAARPSVSPLRTSMLTRGAGVAGGIAEMTTSVGQQLRRQVVDAVIAAVLQRLERHAFAGAGQAGDDDELHVWWTVMATGGRVIVGLASGRYSIHDPPPLSFCAWRAMNSWVLSMPRNCST